MLAICATGWAQVTERVSVSSSGEQGNHLSQTGSVSADGRFIAFWSRAGNFVPGDTSEVSDIYVRDRVTGQTVCASVSSNGVLGNQNSWRPSISADGRFVAFDSYATNLVLPDTTSWSDVYVRDLLNGATTRVSVASDGTQGNLGGQSPALSADGRYVAFYSSATNLVAGDTNGFTDVFVHDRQSAMTRRISVDSGGMQSNGYSSDGSGASPAMSYDGRLIAFVSHATNLDSGDTNGVPDVFVHDLQSGVTRRVSVNSVGAESDGSSHHPSISADGRYVAFTSEATNLVSGDVNGASDVFVHDRQSGSMARVSVDSNGLGGDFASGSASISADGMWVSFASIATNLVAGDTNAVSDVFLHDRRTGQTARVSVSSTGAQANGWSFWPSTASGARYVAFDSEASNLILADTNNASDIFVHDHDAAGFASLCDPGVSGVLSCPCSNAPSGPGRGCDNSTGTGGASLSASGAAYLSMDSLVMTTTGELATATSIVMQGDAEIPPGVVFGQGVRCVGGSLKRLYVKTASGGGISAPDFSAGDPTVSARASQLGDMIQAGQIRLYLVFYRDPIVSGGCPASSTFNATQTGRVIWSL